MRATSMPAAKLSIWLYIIAKALRGAPCAKWRQGCFLFTRFAFIGGYQVSCNELKYFSCRLVQRNPEHNCFCVATDIKRTLNDVDVRTPTFDNKNERIQ